MRIRYLLACSFVVMALPALAAEKNLQVTKPIYQWKTESNNDDKGFNHCLVKNMYDNGIMMILAQNRENIIRLALHFPQDKMQPNQQFDLSLQVDRRDVFPVEALAINKQIMTIAIPDSLPDQLRKGQALYLRGPKDEVVFQLNGMDGAVSALNDCVTTNTQNKNIKTATANNVPDDLLDGDDTAAKEVKPVTPVTPIPVKVASAEKPPAALPPPMALPAPAPIKPAPTVKPLVAKAPPVKAKAAPPPPPAPVPVAPLLPMPLDRVFAKAELSPKTLLLGKAGQIAGKPLDYAWRAEPLLIGLKQQAPLAVPSVQLPQFTTQYLAQLRNQCSGEFVAEASSFDRLPRLLNGGGWILAEAACAPKDGGKETITALLFMAETKQTTIYLVEAPSDMGSAAIKARNGLLQAFLTTGVVEGDAL